jgi:hypothetical protein
MNAPKTAENATQQDRAMRRVPSTTTVSCPDRPIVNPRPGPDRSRIVVALMEANKMPAVLDDFSIY